MNEELSKQWAEIVQINHDVPAIQAADADREVFMVPVPGEGGGLHIRKQRLYCCKECMLKGETHQQ